MRLRVGPLFCAALSLLAMSSSPVVWAQRSENAAAETMTGRATSDERAVVTSHSTELNGKALSYKATAGTLTIQNHDGDPTASMFYVAYTVEQAKGMPPRPVTFLFNGGPGSASHWLNIGGIGPVQAVTPSAGPDGSRPLYQAQQPRQHSG